MEWVGLLKVALSIWNHKLADKYRSQVINYERIIRDENAKAESERIQSVIDHAQSELHIIRKSFISTVQGQNSNSQ